ncbi:MAG: pantetheine-phosphate adenylyltransferase [Gammaproteobacteria bacterium RIFCSPHIGHO2_12_FULL_35_23]|nr:MAG: pantetheine-phosphate adenylyltransferase [Gammaproteobacteria bacterium RIFCSPHIGHO2_12_FULL_35_23]
MKKNIAIYPGTFDPITNGHVSIINRASKLFDKVIIAIAKNEKKVPLFSLQERINLINEIFAGRKEIEVKGFDTLLVHFTKATHANIILRGLRAVSDFDFEFQLAGMNRSLDSNIETLFLTPDNHYTYLSSSLIREIASLKGDVNELVPANVAQALHKKFNSQ